MQKKRPDDGADEQLRPTFWGVVAHAPLYLAITQFVFKSERTKFLILLSLPLVWVFFAHLGPIMQMIHVGFLDAYPTSAGVKASYTLENWTVFFREWIFFYPFYRTMAFATTLTFLTLLIIYPVAYFLAKHVKRKNQMLFLLILLLPFWAGEIVRTYAVMILLGNNGAVNLLLQSMGLIDRPIPFMFTTFSLGLGFVYVTSLFMLLPLYSALEKIPRNYSEAASDLGAGPWTRFWRVTLPLSLDGVSSGCILVFLISIGYYSVPVLLGGPNTTLFAQTIAGFFHVAGNKWPVGAAFSGIMLISALALTGIFSRIMKSLTRIPKT